MQDLVRRARKGDAEAFEALYRALVGRVYALCLRLTGNPSDAEELTQESFVRLWNKLHTFRGESAFTSWVHRLTVNVVLQNRRSSSRRPQYISDDDAIARAPSAESRGLSEEERMDLEAAIARLPDGAREVYVLYEIEGYSHEEIGHIAGIAPSTSRVQLCRARKTLRDVLKA